MPQKKSVIIIAGMPGAGKGVASSAAADRGLPVLVFGDVIREETEQKKLPPTPENIGKVMLQIRNEEGPTVVAKRIITKLEKMTADRAVIEGARSMDEIYEFRKKYNVHLVAVHASPQTRFKRLLERGRSDDPKDWRDFEERDLRELKVGLGFVISLADDMLVNEGSKEELRTGFGAILKKIH